MEFSRLAQRMLQSLGVPPRVILLVCCDFLTLFACTFFVLCLRALWGDLNITSYDWMLSMLLLAPWAFTGSSRCLPMWKAANSAR